MCHGICMCHCVCCAPACAPLRHRCVAVGGARLSPLFALLHAPWTTHPPRRCRSIVSRSDIFAPLMKEKYKAYQDKEIVR